MSQTAVMPPPPLTLTESDLNDHAKMAALVTQGMEIQTLFGLGEVLGLSGGKIAALLSIAKSTLYRRNERHELLKQDESERVLRFLRLYSKALGVFKTKEAAVQWFSSELRALGDTTPMEFAKTEPGARLVEEILGRIPEGVFS